MWMVGGVVRGGIIYNSIRFIDFFLSVYIFIFIFSLNGWIFGFRGRVSDLVIR